MSQTCLIIGGNSGISESLVSLLSAGDTDLSLASRERGESLPLSAEWQEFDATDSSAKLDIPEVLDGLVYCPGSITLKPFGRLSEDDFRNEWELNFLGAVRVIQQALPALKKSNSASIVLYSTVAVQLGMPYHASIAAAKGAVEGLTRSLAAELAPKIRVNAIAPSLTDTPLAQAFLSSDEKRKAAEQRHPLQQVGKPEDMAELTRFLLSQQSQFVTGQIMRPDGGISSVKTL